MSKIAIIRVRGPVNLRQDVKDTLKLLKLFRKNFCVVVEKDNLSLMGMVKKVKDYVTYGDIDDETVNTQFIAECLSSDWGFYYTR